MFLGLTRTAPATKVGAPARTHLLPPTSDNTTRAGPQIISTGRNNRCAISLCALPYNLLPVLGLMVDASIQGSVVFACATISDLTIDQSTIICEKGLFAILIHRPFGKDRRKYLNSPKRSTEPSSFCVIFIAHGDFFPTFVSNVGGHLNRNFFIISLSHNK